MALAGVLHIERQQQILAARKAQHGAFKRRASPASIRSSCAGAI
jgi:hypothetical protein